MGGRQTQHKSTRETRNSKELSDLKRENQSLKRKIAKLQKYTQKLLDSVQLLPEEAVVLTSTEIAEAANKPVDACPSCAQKGLTHVTLPTGIMLVCKSCGWRKKNG